MKKLFLLFITVITIMTSCGSSQIKTDITNYYEGNVANISIKTIDVEENFVDYTNDGELFTIELDSLIQNDYLLDSIKNVKNSLWNIYTGYHSNIENHHLVYRRFDNTKVNWDQYLSEQDSIFNLWKEKCDIYSELLREFASNYWNSVRNEFDNKLNTGTIYVAKLKHFNKFGKKNDHYSYEVFTYNHHGELYKYTGEDMITIITTVYPDAVKDAIQDAVEEFKDLIK